MSTILKRPARPQSPASIRTVLAASLVGTTVEWYDFFLYATAAGLVFPKLFFPVGNETAATLLAFGTFAVGFVARPIGGVIFGHIGDRLGRKRTLVATMLLMAALTPVAGWLADRFGSRWVFGAGVLGFGLTVVPSLLAVRSGSASLTVFVLLLQLGIWYALMTGAESTLFAELFDADVRYTGMSLVFQVSGIWASGLTPVILTALIALGGGSLWWAGGYLVVTALISLVAVATMPRFIGWRPAWAADARW